MIQDVYRALASDEDRNALIFSDVLAALESGRSPVVITERTDHLEAMADRLSRFAKNVIVLGGGQSERKRREALDRMSAIPEQDERMILATGRYLGEGFDDQRLDTLFLTTPIAWRGTLAQYAGRLHRLHDAKRDVRIYDYVDRGVPVLARMAAKRDAGYSAIGYRVADGPRTVHARALKAYTRYCMAQVHESARQTRGVLGGALDDLRTFPAAARREAGYQLDQVQQGRDPDDWKPMSTIG